MTNERRYDIDAIRVMTIGLLLVYHVTISFQEWGIYFQFITNKETIEKLWIPMALINVWRIPILFFISGMGVYFAINKRDWKQLLWERTRRILVPLFFGFFCIVPVHIFIFQKHYGTDLNYTPGFAHLWFLANIFTYVLILAPVFYLLKHTSKNRILQVSRIIVKFPFGVYLFILPFILETLWIKPEIFSLYLFTKHGFWLGLLAFFFGFYFVYIGKEFWTSIAKLKWINLLMASSLFIIRWTQFELSISSYLMAIESILWIFTIFGIAYAYFNHKNHILNYLSKASYPIYIVHMIFQYMSNDLIFNLDIAAQFKYLFSLLFTFIGSFLFYEFVIKRIGFLRPLFGLNYKK